jgi:hypothetical protein
VSREQLRRRSESTGRRPRNIGQWIAGLAGCLPPTGLSEHRGRRTPSAHVFGRSTSQQEEAAALQLLLGIFETLHEDDRPGLMDEWRVVKSLLGALRPLDGEY